MAINYSEQDQIEAPRLFGNLKLWLDSSATSSVVQTSGLISQWQDKSGNNYHLYQESSGLKPLLQSSSINGKDAIIFDGVDDFLYNDSFAEIANGSGIELTVFALYKNSSSTGSYGIAFGSDSSIQPLYAPVYNVSNKIGAQQRTDSGSLFSSVSDNLSSDGYQVQTTVFGQSQLSIFENGDLLTSTNLTQLQTSCNTFTIGAWRRFGSMNGIAFSSIEIGEVIIYNRELSNDERSYVEDYMLNKWNLP